jgi:hypothetical protein
LVLKNWYISQNSDYQLIIPNDGVYLLLLFIKTSDSEQRFNATGLILIEILFNF